MATYIIGDIQGCYDSLIKLLDTLNYDTTSDYLWFCGDLINRGPKSLAVLELIKELDLNYNAANTVLGNHDIHLLSCYFNENHLNKYDNFADILSASDSKDLIYYLLTKPLGFYDKQLNYCVVHAGINPNWSIEQAISLSLEYQKYTNNLLTNNINNNNNKDIYNFFNNIYGDTPDQWSDTLAGIDRYRIIINSFTRMRCVDIDNKLLLDYKRHPNQAPKGYIPWYEKIKNPNNTKIFFGHWAAHQGDLQHKNIFALDTGCVYGGKLTAYCIENNTKYSIDSVEVAGAKFKNE